MNQWYTTDLKF